MRALLDANLFISSLLSPDSASAVVQVVEGAFTGAYTLLLPEGVIAELRGNTATKPYLVSHITPDQSERLVDLLSSIAERIPELDEPFPEVGHDRKDDYLYAHALLGRADFLVSGDRDALAVRQIGEVRIVSPDEFLQILKDAGSV